MPAGLAERRGFFVPTAADRRVPHLPAFAIAMLMGAKGSLGNVYDVVGTPLSMTQDA
ncbi:hypothetical protein [Arthrobacter sp. MMS24-S77]